MKYRFNAGDIFAFDFEQLRKLPGPVDMVMIEKAKRKGYASFAVNSDKTAVADARNDALKSALKLLLTGVPDHFAFAVKSARRYAVFKTHDIAGPRIITLAVIPL
jgi:hypothetical protein